MQLAVEYEKNVMIVKVDTDDEYEFARDMQVILIIMFCFQCMHLHILDEELKIHSISCKLSITITCQLA